MKGSKSLMKAKTKSRSILPGFGMSLGFTVFYLSIIVLIPLAGVFIKTSGLSWEQFWHTVTNARVVASYRISFVTAFAAAVVNLDFWLNHRMGSRKIPVSRQEAGG